MIMSKKISLYACQQCEVKDRQTFRYRGLCKSCTTYDDDGKVIESVKRVLSDEFGNAVKKISREITGPRRGFRQPKKLTNKQRAHVADEVEVPTIVETLAGGEEE